MAWPNAFGHQAPCRMLYFSRRILVSRYTKYFHVAFAPNFRLKMHNFVTADDVWKKKWNEANVVVAENFPWPRAQVILNDVNGNGAAKKA